MVRCTINREAAHQPYAVPDQAQGCRTRPRRRAKRCCFSLAAQQKVSTERPVDIRQDWRAPQKRDRAWRHAEPSAKCCRDITGTAPARGRRRWSKAANSPPRRLHARATRCAAGRQESAREAALFALTAPHVTSSLRSIPASEIRNSSNRIIWMLNVRRTIAVAVQARRAFHVPEEMR